MTATMPAYVVRELTVEDHELLPSLFETLENLRSVGELSGAQADEVLARIIIQDGHLFAAIDPQAGVIGAATLLVEQKFIRQGALCGHIEDVAVRKGFEGKGVASALMERALSYAKERGCYKVILDCSEKLVPFYKKFGFKELDRHMRLDL